MNQNRNMGYPELLSTAIFPELLASNNLVDYQDSTIVTVLVVIEIIAIFIPVVK